MGQEGGGPVGRGKGGAIGMQICRLGGSVVAQRCESVSDLIPSLLRLDCMWAGDVGNGDICAPCPPLGRPLWCGDEGDSCFQPVTEPAKV